MQTTMTQYPKDIIRAISKGLDLIYQSLYSCITRRIMNHGTCTAVGIRF